MIFGVRVPPMFVRGAPPRWVCNARKWHDKSDDECACVGCVHADSPELELGDPFPVHEAYQDICLTHVGLYNPEEKESTSGEEEPSDAGDVQPDSTGGDAEVDS